MVEAELNSVADLAETAVVTTDGWFEIAGVAATLAFKIDDAFEVRSAVVSLTLSEDGEIDCVITSVADAV